MQIIRQNRMQFKGASALAVLVKLIILSMERICYNTQKPDGSLHSWLDFVVRRLYMYHAPYIH